MDGTELMAKLEEENITKEPFFFEDVSDYCDSMVVMSKALKEIINQAKDPFDLLKRLWEIEGWLGCEVEGCIGEMYPEAEVKFDKLTRE